MRYYKDFFSTQLEAVNGTYLTDVNLTGVLVEQSLNSVEGLPNFGTITNVTNMQKIGTKLFAFTLQGIYTKDETELEWTKVNHPTFVPYSIVKKNSTYYISNSSGIHSWDGVNTFTDLNLGFQTYDVVISSSGNIVVATDTGIYYSSDDGANWNPATGLGTLSLNLLVLSNGIILCGTDTTGLYISTNEGLNWTQHGTINSQTINKIRYFETCNTPTSTYVILCATSRKIFFIKDDINITTGTTFTSLNVTANPSTSITDVLLTGNCNLFLITTNAESLWASKDLITTNKIIDGYDYTKNTNQTGLFYNSYLDIVYSFPVNSQEQKLILNLDVFANGVDEVSLVESLIPDDAKVNDNTITATEVFEFNNELYLTSWGNTVQTSFLKKNNSNQEFEPTTNSGLGSNLILSHITYTYSGNDIIIVGTFGNGLYISYDYGENWNSYSTGITNDFQSKTIRCFTYDSVNERIYIGTDKGVYTKLVSVSDWTYIGLNTYSILSLYYDSSSNTLLIGTASNGLWKLSGSSFAQEDGGATIPTNIAIKKIKVLTINSTDYLCICTNDYLYVDDSPNYGSLAFSYVDSSSGLTDNIVNDIVFYSNKDIIYILTQSSGLFEVNNPLTFVCSPSLLNSYAPNLTFNSANQIDDRIYFVIFGGYLMYFGLSTSVVKQFTDPIVFDEAKIFDQYDTGSGYLSSYFNPSYSFTCVDKEDYVNKIYDNKFYEIYSINTRAKRITPTPGDFIPLGIFPPIRLYEFYNTKIAIVDKRRLLTYSDNTYHPVAGNISYVNINQYYFNNFIKDHKLLYTDYYEYNDGESVNLLLFLQKGTTLNILELIFENGIYSSISANVSTPTAYKVKVISNFGTLPTYANPGIFSTLLKYNESFYNGIDNNYLLYTEQKLKILTINAVDVETNLTGETDSYILQDINSNLHDKYFHTDMTLVSENNNCFLIQIGANKYINYKLVKTTLPGYSNVNEINGYYVQHKEDYVSLSESNFFDVLNYSDLASYENKNFICTYKNDINELVISIIDCDNNVGLKDESFSKLEAYGLNDSTVMGITKKIINNTYQTRFLSKFSEGNSIPLLSLNLNTLGTSRYVKLEYGNEIYRLDGNHEYSLNMVANKFTDLDTNTIKIYNALTHVELIPNTSDSVNYTYAIDSIKYIIKRNNTKEEI